MMTPYQPNAGGWRNLKINSKEDQHPGFDLLMLLYFSVSTETEIFTILCCIYLECILSIKNEVTGPISYFKTL